MAEQVQLVGQQDQVKSKKNWQQIPGSKPSAEERPVLVDDQEWKSGGGNNVLSHQKWAVSPVEQKPHDRVELLTVVVQKLDRQDSVQDAQDQNSNDESQG